MERTSERSERILVCLSSSPSNQKVIDVAAKMAEAFQAVLTAIYVRPADYENLPEADKLRLQKNISFAEKNGASVITLAGNDIPVQIAEYARISGTTKIVMGRSGAKRQHFWSKAPLTERIILSVPNVDVYIIPDSAADLKQQSRRMNLTDWLRPTAADTLITVLVLLGSTGVGLLFTHFGFSEANIITVFILGVLIISITAVSPLYSVFSSLAGVLLFNYFFIDPKFSFHTYEPEYAVTFGIMLISSLITGTLANRLKDNARQSSREAFRAKVLFDTNQLLQKAESPEEVIRITAQQMKTLLDRDVTVYTPDGEQEPGAEHEPDGGQEHGSSRKDVTVDTPDGERKSGSSRKLSVAFADGSRQDTAQEENADVPRQVPDKNEAEIAEWVFLNQRAAGAYTENYSGAGSVYHPIFINGHSYGVIGIRLNGRRLEAFESSVFVSILGECALALDSLRNAAEREQAAVTARNEQLRSNLLRSVSHDIRTPLTSISGNASNLLAHYEQLDKETLKQIFTDIYDDSEWLIDLVENLLFLSRIENGQMILHLSLNVMNDVIEEALKHVDKKASQHRILVEPNSEVLIAKMDARLITQVLINLINNAVNNTQDGSEILIRSRQSEGIISVSVEDNGPGIPDDRKKHIFEMFSTGTGKVTDGRRGVGIGLSLCRSIVEAHGGSICLTDNRPTGCCFTFTLPAEEVTINE